MASIVIISTLGLVATSAAESVRSAREDRPGALEFVRFMGADLPPNALVLTFYHQSLFLAQYGSVVEGRRPDVVQAHLSLGGRERGNLVRGLFARRHPEWADAADAYDRESGFPVGYLSKLAGQRSVVFEPVPSMVGLPIENMEIEHFYVQIHQNYRSSSCRPDELERGLIGVQRDLGTTGLSAAIGFSLMGQTMFHFRKGDIPCAVASYNALKALAGVKKGRMEPYFSVCASTADPGTSRVARPTQAMRNFPNPFGQTRELPDPDLVCPRR
jgi:hypothetical protein